MSSSFWISDIDILIPGVMPSITTPTAAPW
jgi:hypothetical protein